MKYTVTINDLHTNKKLNPKGCQNIKNYKKMVQELIINGVAFDFEINQELPNNIKFIDLIDNMCLKDIYNEAREKIGHKFITLKNE